MITNLYIGSFEEGTTSFNRAIVLNDLLKNNLEIIDTSIPFNKLNRIFKSIGFRYKAGPLIKEINSFIVKNLKGPYHVIWIDKGVYITPHTITILRNISKILIHYTPDFAFFGPNKSAYFEKTISKYDYAITTKSFEINQYRKYLDEKRIFFYSPVTIFICAGIGALPD